jgi:hypothetical protein
LSPPSGAEEIPPKAEDVPSPTPIERCKQLSTVDTSSQFGPRFVALHCLSSAVDGENVGLSVAGKHL